jgi:hypothetical protein
VSEYREPANEPLFALPRQRQLAGKVVVQTPLAGGALDLHLHRLTPRCGALGEARERVGEPFALALDVKDIAMARRGAPGGLLPGARNVTG